MSNSDTYSQGAYYSTLYLASLVPKVLVLLYDVVRRMLVTLRQEVYSHFASTLTHTQRWLIHITLAVPMGFQPALLVAF